jgi:hypothetical protein
LRLGGLRINLARITLPLLRTLLLIVALIAYSRAPVSAQNDTGSVFGRVLAGDTGEGLAFAPIYVYNDNNSEVARASADANGLFNFSLPPGVYYLNFSSPQRYVQGQTFQYPANDYVDQFLGGAASIELARPITITAGAQVQVPVQTLARGGVITGRIYDALTNATITGRLIEISAFSCRYSATSTDSLGRYVLTGLPLAPHRMYERGNSSFYNGKTTLDAADFITVTSAVTIPDIDFPITTNALQTSKALRVKYQSPNGDSVADVYGALYRPDGRQVPTSSTSDSSQGTQDFYDIPSNESGPFKLRIFGSPTRLSQYFNGKSTFAAADPIMLTGAQTYITMTLAELGGATISGVVVDQDTGEVIRSISSLGEGPNMAVSGLVFDSDGSLEGSLTMLPTGEFVTNALLPGTYRLQVSTSGILAQHVPRAVTITIGSQPISRTIQLQRGGTIAGRVTVSGTNHGVESPIVSLFYADGRPYVTPVHVGYWPEPTSRDGRYRFATLPPGFYRVRVNEHQLQMMPDCRTTAVLPPTFFERTVPAAALSAGQSTFDIVVRAGEVTTADIAMPVVPFVTVKPSPTANPTAPPAATATQPARATRLFLPLTRR